MKPVFYLFVLTLGLFSCSTYSDDELNDFDKNISDYLTEKDIKCERSESGLYFNILEEGEGDYIQFRDRVSFTYKGEFLDGKVFDESGDTLSYKVSELIGAWKEIMLQLKNGGEAFLVAPPQLGYGTHNLDDIPANSVLVFNMKVIDVE